MNERLGPAEQVAAYEYQGPLITSETYCFGIFKPDAISLGIVPDIELTIGGLGLAITHRRVEELTPEDVLLVWPAITTPHVSRTVPYMTSAPVEVFVVEGEAASERMLTVKKRFRQLYPSENPVISVMHTTDHDQELLPCLRRFFGEDYEC